MSKKIMHLLTGTSFSGAENVACQIMACFKNDAEYEMFYCSPDGKIREALKERNVRFAPMKEWSLSEVKRIIREEKPDIIHAHDMKASFFAALLCGRIPLISHVHNNNFDSRGISAKALFYRYAAQKAKHIFWVSKSAYEGYAFHEQFEGKSSILYNVIDAEEVYKKAAQDEKEYAYDIVYVGRLTPPKNPQRLVKVLAGIAEKYPKMKAAIIGTGDLEAETKQAIAEHHAELPMCALEAMALGVPIVSTPTDGLKEIVDDGKTGYLSDDDDVLIERCTDVLENKELYQNLHHATLEKAAQILDIKTYKEALDKVYRQTM